ncbi:MAG TPA: phosphoribosylformylglycinamidine synthase subunit PurQ [Gemmatimonadaceae bacterium]|nr:phosphoribosylformylglycinamidine synthase subunit PurQ [Gemmatimonadaceae bacterium]
MKFGIVTFPGSNCDYDAYHAVTDVLGADAVYLWHKAHDLEGADVVVLPGGFSYGDYLRAGAIARFSPIMREVAAHARRGGPVIGICNGFQILCEAGLLPGALLRNANLQFVSEPVRLRVENAETMFTHQYRAGQLLRLPVAHGEGRFTGDAETLDRLEGDGRVVFRYVDAAGEPTADASPNGSARNIAGIVSAEGNVLGMMPHPERAVEAVLGSTDGLGLFQSMLARVSA